MTTKALALFFLLFAALAQADQTASTPSPFSPIFDLRVRQEMLEKVLYFDAADPDRDWVRFRTRAGAKYDAGAHEVSLRLANESRAHVHPSGQDFDWDELIIDRLCWRWRTGGQTQLTVGRQDIIWNRGFLVMDGTPLDGSRTAYHNAARLQSDLGDYDLDLSLIIDPKYDPIVLVEDERRPLTDADEWACALRVRSGPWQWSVIFKAENDPDDRLQPMRTITAAARYDLAFGATGSLWADLAVQRQDFDRRSNVVRPFESGWAVAAQAFVKGNLEPELSAEGGFFFYSGDDGKDLRAFRTPWGRWPKWSELYIYTLIGESTPGRSTVAAWENIAAPRVRLEADLGEGVAAHLAASYLLAPQPDWQARGLLLQTGVQADLSRLVPGLSSHLVYELFEPGSFHTDTPGRPDMTATAHFLRWQLVYALK